MKSIKGTKVLLGPSVFASLDSAPLNYLLDSGYVPIDNPFKRKLTKPELLDLLSDDVTGVIAGLEPLDREVMEKSNLKVISRCGSGMSNVDLKAADDLGIQVCSTPYGPTSAVAELTIGVMLSMLRMLPLMDNDLHRGKWNKRIGSQLEGKTVVIIGFGKIGKQVASLLKPFNVVLLAVDHDLQGTVEGVEVKPLDKALSVADIITIHSSGDQQIIGSEEFKLIKKGTFLMNAARGGLVDESSLIEALESGKIAGAWLDTFSVEPYTGPLTEYSQVLLTPHVGSYTLECRKSMEMEAAKNLIAAFEKIQ